MKHYRSIDPCWYCGAAVAFKSSRGDHMPLPQDCGGMETVPCCQTCHDMKDRFSLDSWPTEFMTKVFQQLNGQPREIKIFVAKVTRLFAQHLKDKKVAA